MRDLYFAEFYTRKGKRGRWLHPDEDDSVCVLDGRMMLARLKIRCAAEARARGYGGFRIARGKFDAPAYLTPNVIEV